jgi:hypothetical protein
MVAILVQLRGFYDRVKPDDLTKPALVILALLKLACPLPWTG